MPDFTPLFKLFARQRAAALRKQNPTEVQVRTLLGLTRWAAGTAFGKAHDFSRIRSVQDFQNAVPLRTYEDMWRDWWQAPFPIHDNVTSPGRTGYFAVTSGTTSGATKYIPVTRQMVASNKKAAMDTAVHHLVRHPDSRLLGGRTFMMGGSTELVREAPGVLSGDLSGIATRTQSPWTRPFSWPPEETALLSDWDEKLGRFVNDAVSQNITIWTGVPSWMLILLERIALERPGQSPFGNLQLLIHGGVAWDLYRDRFSNFLAETGAATREVYPASEGFIASADRGDGEGLRLNMDHGLFFEFVPLDELGSERPTRHWVGNIQTGVDYAIAVTSCAGVHAYLIGDTVRFVDRSPPRLLITGRTSYMLSAFGEHLIGSEIDQAINEAAARQAVQITEYTVGPFLSQDAAGRGRHIWLVEAEGDFDTGQMSRDIDDRLSAMNDDYRAHRSDGTGMEAPTVERQSTDVFKRWMASKGKLGGQHKVPRVISDAARFQTMLDEFRALN